MGAYEDISMSFQQIGVPYYLEQINGKYYMTNHGSKHAIYQFDVNNNMVCNIENIF